MRSAHFASAVVAVLALATCDKATPVAPGDSGLEISANPTRIEIDSTSTITVIARKSDGNPVNEGTEINLATTLGEIDAIIKTNNRGVATGTLRGGSDVGVATVTASSGAAASVGVDVQVGSLAGSITLQASPRKVPKDGGDVELVSVVRDDRGNRLRNAVVNFSTDAGTLDSGGGGVITDVRGEAKDMVRVTQFDLEAVTDGFFTVTAQTTGGDTSGTTLLEATDEVAVGGFPGDLTLTLSASSIPAFGGSIGLTALVRTDGGRPARDAQVNFITQVGSLTSGGTLMPTDSQGQAFDTLFASEEDLRAFGQSVFTVSAETTGSGGEILSDMRSINVQSSGPTADFTYARTTGTTVQFTNLTIGDAPIDYQWDFQSDGQIDSTQKDPLFDYGAFGTFEATLIATNAFGEDTATRVVVVAGAGPTADFTFATSSNTAFVQGIVFTSTSTGEGTLSYAWDIDSDGSIESQAQTFTYEFDVRTGDVSITLTVINDFGTDSITKIINLPL
jgi:Invasin, domain 3/PKD domain